jgi:hypothetical protein
MDKEVAGALGSSQAKGITIALSAQRLACRAA